MKKIIGILFTLFVISCGYSQEQDSLSFSKGKLIFERMNDEIDSLTLKKRSEEFKKSIGKPHTTTFYEIFLNVKLKETYKLSERKKLNLGISNWGCKDFYVPEWLSREFREKDELFIELFKKDSKGEFVVYRSSIHTSIQENKTNRKIVSLKNRQSHCFNDIKLDLLNKITEKGTYLVKVHIDLSNFGYFKKLIVESTSFKVN